MQHWQDYMLRETLHLLLGGDGKGADFSELADLINQPHISTYCFGRDGKTTRGTFKSKPFV